jgi:hypothetical protein
VASFYRYLPDLSVAQLMFTAGLTAAVLGGLGVSAARNGPRLRTLTAALAAAGLALAVTATTLAGTGRLDAHGMIVIPALHDAASGQPVSYTPSCSRTAIPVCLHPAYAAFRPAVTAAVAPELAEMAGLPGAPARISQVPGIYRQGPGNSITTLAETRGRSEFALPDRVPGQPGTTSAEFASQLIQSLGLPLVSDVILGGSGRSAGLNPSPAELAVIGGSVRFPPSVEDRDLAPLFGRLLPVPGSPTELAARRFAKLTPAARHDWLAHHLAALRAGRISLGQLP